MPLFADYLYRADHEAGIDVSKNTNLEGLLATFKLESPEEILQADGNEHLVFVLRSVAGALCGIGGRGSGAGQ